MPRYTPQAWLLSVCFHATLFVLGALLWRQAAPAGVEPDRRGEVALAVSTPERTEYLTFEEQSLEATQALAVADSALDGGGPLPDVRAATAANMPQSLQLPAPTAIAPPAIALDAPRTAAATTVKLPSTTDYSEFLAAERARIQSQMPRGEPVEVSVFGGPASVGRSFVFVIDRSKSMGGSGLNALRPAAREMTAALSRLEAVHRFTVIAYHHSNTYLDGPKLLDATPSNQQRVLPFVNGLAAFGQTEHEMALLGALGLEPDVIYLFTDGGDPYLTEPQLKSIAANAARQQTTIHCVQFGMGPLRDANNFLVRLANACSGGFTYLDMSRMKPE